ncbi:MAG: hypothetical protein JWO72_1268 [Caulobacteraceae bacterium]|nr:hypothetical protein [Caulobacteraceae bacterium]
MTLDGPFVVWDRRTGVTTTDPDTGEAITTCTPSLGVHYETDPATLAASPALQPYVVTPTTRLQSVWAGDDAENPKWTVSLVFPDQATADAVVRALGETTPDSSNGRERPEARSMAGGLLGQEISRRLEVRLSAARLKEMSAN